jgi:protein-tyrosine-phosphatase/predicted ATP-grasp superfamily ATP-dependent carboligase
MRGAQAAATKTADQTEASSDSACELLNQDTRTGHSVVTRMRILVTDAHELGGLGAIRSLGSARHHVIAGYPDRLPRPPSTYSQYCSTHRAYPDPWLSQADFSDWLVANAAEADLILPVSEAAIVAAMSCQSRLPSAATVIAPSPTSLQYTLSKRRATMRAVALGIPCPRTAFSVAELPTVEAPYLVKTDNRLMGDGSYRKGKNWYIDDAGELSDLLVELDERGEQWVVQEYVVGTGEGAFLLTWQGRLVLEFAHQRIHEVPFHGGVSSLRKSVRDPALVAMAAKLLAAIGYAGVAMVEFRRSRLNQLPYFLEINGRLWGSIALALHAGADFPAKLVDCYAGGTVVPASSADYAAEIYCRNVYPGEVDYLRSVLTARGPVRGVSPPGRVRAVVEFFSLFFAPRVHYDYLWIRDPLPWLWQGIRACGQVFRSRWNRRQRHARQRRLVKQFERQPRAGAPDLRAVLFLCYGNICRSAFAAAYWNQGNGSLAAAESAGFYPRANRRTPTPIVRLAKGLGVDLADHRSRVVDSQAIEQATAIFIMDGQNLEALLTTYPQVRQKAWLLGSFRGLHAINDPYGLPEAQACESLRQIKDSVDVVLQRYAGDVRAEPAASTRSASVT